MQQRTDCASQTRIFFGYTVRHLVMTAVDYFAGLPLVIFLLRTLVCIGDILLVEVVLAKVTRLMVVPWRICREFHRIPPRLGCLVSLHGARSQRLTKSIKSRVPGGCLNYAAYGVYWPFGYVKMKSGEWKGEGKTIENGNLGFRTVFAFCAVSDG